MRLPRRRAVPSHVPLERGERVLTSARGRQGEWYVGTDRSLLAGGDGGWHRIEWVDVERAEWDRERDELVVVEVADFGEPEPRQRLGVEEPGRLLELVRERVTASVVSRRFTAVEGRRGITVVARRAPHADGPLTWSVVVDPTLDAASPTVQEAVRRALGEARAELEPLA